MARTQYIVYILHCQNHSFYTGYTTNLQRRYQQHILGSKQCKYTRSFKPIAIAQYWFMSEEKQLAMKIERMIKKMNKAQKSELILYPFRLNNLVEAMETFCQPGISTHFCRLDLVQS